MKELTPFEQHVIEKGGTEAPHTGLYTHTAVPGAYHCKRCDALLYRSEDKFASHCGWPSFDDEVPGAVKKLRDADGSRTEIRCAACDAHLGHVFSGERFTDKNTRHCVNSVSLTFVPKKQEHYQKAVFASGCFWGTQYFLSRLPGVIDTQVGYIGGQVQNPTYKEVCSGKTGHVEAVEVTYDPKVIGFAELTRVYFETHDFTQTNGQGPDIGSQYLSVLYYGSPEEETTAQTIMAQLEGMGYKVATQLKPLETFWKGEDYHQNYYEKKGDTPYCHRYREIFPRPKDARLS